MKYRHKLTIVDKTKKIYTTKYRLGHGKTRPLILFVGEPNDNRHFGKCFGCILPYDPEIQQLGIYASIKFIF